jgi:hypothetical protein
MPLGRAGRAFLGAGTLVVVAAILMAAARPWSSDSGSSRLQVGGVPLEAEVIETGVGLDRGAVAGVVEWRGALVAVTSAGAVTRSPDVQRWEKVAATGFTPPGRDACRGDAVGSIAAGKELLIAVGEQYVPPEPSEEYCETRLRVWRSRDAATWEVVESVGIEDTDRVDAVMADTAGFLAFGSAPVPENEASPEHGRGVTLWRSTDGQSWERVPTEDLSKPGEYKYQSIKSIAARGTHTLAVMSTECVECFDDDVLGAFRSDGGGRWSELKLSGLDALDQANSDLIPAVAATSQGYFAFASVGEEHSDNREPAAWFSADGARWDELALDGPSPSSGSMDAAASTSRGVVALDNTRSGLVVWRVQRP